jgi:hypothetical protein
MIQLLRVHDMSRTFSTTSVIFFRREAPPPMVSLPSKPERSGHPAESGGYPLDVCGADRMPKTEGLGQMRESRPDSHTLEIDVDLSPSCHLDVPKSCNQRQRWYPRRARIATID